MSYFSKIILHMVFMGLFLLFAAAGIITARYFKKRNPKWMKIHKLFMISGLTSAIMGISWIIFVVQTEQGIHFYAPHTFLGLGTFLLALTAPILGILFTGKKTNKNLKPVLRKFHKIIGWSSLILILSTILTGLIHFGIITVPF
ncbi:MAG: hypothetical protein KAH95_13425 [Spirochaetales bacterium]|nr:hypothetical protein [Spirochaetales bacterium]